MMKKRTMFLSLGLLLLATACALADEGGRGGKTLTVGQSGTPCPNAQYTTIAAAVRAANSGDVVEVCPALYAEQLVITKPLTLRGIEVNGINRVLLQPSLTVMAGLATEAVITVMNTNGVTVQNLALDASHNTVSSCNPGVAGIQFFNASGTVENSAIFGAHLMNPLSCTALPFGNGFGVQVYASQSGPFRVSVRHNSIHDFTANGVQVTGTGIAAEIDANTISGVGPSSGIFQFGIFIINGAVAQITNNVITEGLCGSLAISDCINVRSEGVTLRAIGDGTVVDGNIISNAQSGIFINGANRLRVTNNQIRNIDAMSGMDIQGTASGFFTNSVIDGNGIFNVGPIDQNASNNEEGCGINEYSGTGTFSGNRISNNVVNDAYCGVAHVTADTVQGGIYFNTLYTELNSDLFPVMFPPAVEP
jgi:nitrous oxidase accessory protein NosD